MYTHISTFPDGPGGPPKRLSPEPTIHPTCILKNCELGSWTELGAYTRMQDTRMGDYSYTAGNVQAIYTTIGKFCSIANSVRINPGNHPSWRVTQHHATYRSRQYGFAEEDDEAFFEWRKAHDCQIGHDVWIGHAALILPGTKIGTGAIIGGGAVVTRDVGPYEVAVGVPARVIKRRFPESISERLLTIQWWDWDRPTLEQRFEDLKDIELFLEKYG